MIEILQSAPEFEQSAPREKERTYLPLFPEQLAEYRTHARPVEQYYLSRIDEPFSLRLRETIDHDGSLQYTSTLKDRGTLGADGLDRLEVEIPVSADWYDYYKSEEAPVVRKLRADVNNHVAIDFYEDSSITIESEDPIAWQAFVDQHGDHFIKVTGDRQADNEWRAHLGFRRANGGREALTSGRDLAPEAIVRGIMTTLAATPVVFAHIGGRSGSGKSTIVHDVRRQLGEYGIESVILSTDDYHRGNTWLTEYNHGEPWSRWDDAIVYDTQGMACDLDKLCQGEAIPRRQIDFTVVEPVYRGMVAPAPVILIEGIYARSPDIASNSSLQYEMTTPLATCIGRRLLRDMRERPEFADPHTSLRYMLEQAEPSYRAQVRI